MSSSSDIGLKDSGKASEPDSAHPDASRTNWREALMGLVASRVALIQLESKDAARGASKRAVLIAAACGCAFAAWMLILAGGVSIISQSTGWPWNWVAVGLAALHLLVGIILAQAAKSTDTPTFPATRAEFQKDREWIENFNKPRNSSD